MNVLHILSKSRGPRNLLSRIRTVATRFGFSPRRFNLLLERYHAITRELGCVPTLPITAVVLKRHPELIRAFSEQGIEFAVHGHVHIDHGVISLEEQVKHFRKAAITFNACGVPFVGFRAPFLRINDHTLRALSEVGFAYDSSCVIHWDILDKTRYREESWREYERVLAFYRSRPAEDYLALPRMVNNFVEIPVSMPDDEIMTERLGIADEKEMVDIWSAITQNTYTSGELFTIQLHPERITGCGGALAAAVKLAKQYQPPVWVATLREIAAWWQERSEFVFDIESPNKGKYRIRTACSDRATVLVKNGKVDVPAEKWFAGYDTVNDLEFVLESSARPVIGVKPNSSEEAISFLRSEGYPVESGDHPEEYSVYLNDLEWFTRADEKILSRRIEQSDAPLVRYWRWPARARSAISVTGDIDSITITDFVLRIIENSLENRRRRKKQHHSS